DAPDASVSEARDVLTPLGFGNAKIQFVGTDNLRVQAEPGGEEALDEVTAALAGLAGAKRTEVAISTVGPTWGDEILSKAQRALVVFLVIIAAYMAIRLEWKMAVGALAALVHDIFVTV